jgi:ubiquinone/menaquinone biosynthesis C-methylase UbiE
MTMTADATPGSTPTTSSAGAAAAETIAYHLAELEVARTPGDPRRVMPDVPPTVRAVLDVGCGVGQTLMALDLPHDDVMRCGVDVDHAALAAGRTLDPRLGLAQAPGEALPFADGSFDFVLCRVALPYMDIPRAAAEMARVLRPGGQLWAVLHPVRFGLSALAAHARRGQPKGALFQLYVLANGLALHAAGRQFRFPFGARPLESVQTGRGIRVALERAGFEGVATRRDRFFVVTAHTRAR